MVMSHCDRPNVSMKALEGPDMQSLHPKSVLESNSMTTSLLAYDVILHNTRHIVFFDVFGKPHVDPVTLSIP